jgi:DNA polymerase-3 subunit delta
MLKDLRSDIKNKIFKSVYLLYGEERFLVRKYEAELLSVLSDEPPDIFDGKRDIPDIINAAQTPSFFSARRVVLVRDSGLFESGRKNDSEEMAEWIKSLPAETADFTVIFNERGNVDKRGKMYKSVSAAGRAAEMARPEEAELIKWLCLTAKKNGVSLQSSAAAFMLRHCGADMDMLDGELEKLISYVGQAGEIKTNDIRNVCSQTISAKIFDMVGAIGKKDAQTALKVFSDLIALKESPIMVITMIARQFRLIYECKVLSAEGLGQAAIAERLSQRAFVVRECLSQGANFNAETLLRALNDCLNADVAVKSGRIGDSAAVEVLIAEYAR